MDEKGDTVKNPLVIEEIVSVKRALEDPDRSKEPVSKKARVDTSPENVEFIVRKITTRNFLNLVSIAKDGVSITIFDVSSTPHGEVIKTEILRVYEFLNEGANEEFDTYMRMLHILKMPDAQRADTYRLELAGYIDNISLVLQALEPEDWGKWRSTWKKFYKLEGITLQFTSATGGNVNDSDSD